MSRWRGGGEGEESWGEGARGCTRCTECPVGTDGLGGGAWWRGGRPSGATGSGKSAGGEGYERECVNCVKGRFQSETGKASCKACEAGKYGDAEEQTTNTCKACGQGKYNSAAVASESTQCTECPVGTYGLSAMATSAGGCTSCDAGTANPLSGQSLATACVNCVKGRVQSETGKASCKACEGGKFGDAEEQKTDTCKDCGKGKYNSAAGASESTQCTELPVITI